MLDAAHRIVNGLIFCTMLLLLAFTLYIGADVLQHMGG